MHQVPSQEGPRAEGEIHHSENYSLPQRHRRFTASEFPPKIFHTDEHPEIPKIKRASRPSSIQNNLPISLARTQTHRQKQRLPLVASSPHQKLIITGGIILTVILLILVVTTT